MVKEKFYNSEKLWDVNVDNIVLWKLVLKNNNSKYFIGIKFDKSTRPFVSLMPKMSGYVKTPKVTEGDKDKSNKLISIPIEDEKLLEKI